MSTIRILVVDDSIADFNLIDNFIGQALPDTVTVDHAPSMETAARLIAENDYVVILRDLYQPPCHLPKIDQPYVPAAIAVVSTRKTRLHPKFHIRKRARSVQIACAIAGFNQNPRLHAGGLARGQVRRGISEYSAFGEV